MKWGQISGMVLVALVILSAYEIVTDDVRILVVLSSSMEPLMHPGDLIVVKRGSDVAVGDVVAFSDPTGKKNVLITHRVIEADEEIRTKGDAVEDPDPFTVTAKDVYGKLVFGVPYLGYFFHEFKNRNVVYYLLFILLPASVLMVSEVRNLSKSDAELRRESWLKRKVDRRRRKLLRPLNAIAVFTISFIVFSLSISPVLTYDEKEIVNSGYLDVYVFHSDPPYYSLIKPGESFSTTNYAAVNGVVPLIMLYPLYLSGLLWALPFLLSLITTTLLSPLYYKPRKRHIL